MSKAKINKVIKTLRLLGQCTPEGESRIKLSDVSFWSGLNKMTTYRKLIELEKLGIVERVKHGYKNTEIHYWMLTPSGLELAEQRDLL